MKTLLLFISITFFSFSASFSQSGWFPLNSGTTEWLQSVFFTDANTGYVTGNNGIVLKTTNAGNNWTSQTLPPGYLLRFVFFTDINTGYIVSGDIISTNGLVYKTTNGGVNWNTLALPYYCSLYSTYFNNSNTGYVTGYNTILKTTNAGIVWTSNNSFALGYITSIDFVNPNTGFASAFNERVILKTTNAGINWQVVFDGGIYNAGFFGIDFIDANTGVAVGGNPSTAGNAFILRTTNGGLNWSNCDFNNSNIYRLWSVRFLSPSIGYIAGGGLSGGIGAILKTTNGGINWYFQTTNVDSALNGNYFTSVNTGYVVGSNGRILKTTDGGGNFIGIETIGNKVPTQFSLLQNYPNPFNPVTTIKFDIAKTGFVTLKIYNILGKEIKSLANEKLEAGSYNISWNASDFPSGVYFYRIAIHSDKIKTEGFSDVKRMILIK